MTFSKYHPQVLSAPVPEPLFKTLIESNCSTIEEKFFPLIKIQHNDEIYNSSFDLIESADGVSEHSGYLFSITCVAHYPIEWVVNYFFVSFFLSSFSIFLNFSKRVNYS
jgi:hypothetical protein